MLYTQVLFMHLMLVEYVSFLLSKPRSSSSCYAAYKYRISSKFSPHNTFALNLGRVRLKVVTNLKIWSYTVQPILVTIFNLKLSTKVYNNYMMLKLSA